MNKILNFGKTSLYIGPLLDISPFGKKECMWLPKPFYFDGGSYFKTGFYFLGHVIEFSRTKKDKTVYKHLTQEEVDTILKKLK